MSQGEVWVAHPAVTTRKTAASGLEVRLRARAELAQHGAIEAGVQPDAFVDDQDHLPVRYGSTHVFRHVESGRQREFLVAGGTWKALFAGQASIG